MKQRKVNKNFSAFLKTINSKRYSRNTSLGTVFAETFKPLIRDLLKRPVFEKGDGSWIDVLPIITKEDNIRIHTSTNKHQLKRLLKRTKDMFTINYWINERKYRQNPKSAISFELLI